MQPASAATSPPTSRTDWLDFYTWEKPGGKGDVPVDCRSIVNGPERLQSLLYLAFFRQVERSGDVPWRNSDAHGIR